MPHLVSLLQRPSESKPVDNRMATLEDIHILLWGAKRNKRARKIQKELRYMPYGLPWWWLVGNSDITSNSKLNLYDKA